MGDFHKCQVFILARDRIGRSSKSARVYEGHVFILTRCTIGQKCLETRIYGEFTEDKVARGRKGQSSKWTEVEVTRYRSGKGKSGQGSH